MRQPKWNQYEVALLLEAYWNIKENKELKKGVITELSNTLRSFATSQGVMVDMTYRNENGISMKMGELDYLFFGDDVGLKNTSDLFRKMVQLYKDDYNGFKKILMEAKGMNDIQDKTRRQFCEWLTINAPKVQPDLVCRFLPVAEEFCLKIKVLSAPLFETKDEIIIKRFAKAVSQNKIFRIKNKKQINNIISAANWYYLFIRDFPTNTPAEDAISTEPVTPIGTCNTNIVVDFESMPSLAYTKPVKFTYCGTHEESVSNWTELYVKLFQRIYSDYAGSIPVGRSFYKSGRTDFGTVNGMTAPKRIIEDYYLETNISATEIVKKIAALLDICEISPNDIIIEYQEKMPSKASSDRTQAKADTRIKSGSNLNITFFEWLKNIEKMGDGTCRSYVSALNNAETYAREHNLPNKNISCVDVNEALSTISCLMADEGFQQINQKQHNCFSAAFQKMAKYFSYLNSDGADEMDTPLVDISERTKSAIVQKNEIVPTGLTCELSAFLKESTGGISKEAILAHFPAYSTQQVNRALLACHAVKVLKKYHHKENISDYDEMADILLDVLTKQFAANGDYASAHQLYNEAHFRLDDFFFYNNAFESRLEVYDLAVHLFTQENYKGKSFLFLNGMHIWREEPNYPKDFHGLLIKYGREHQNVFTREQALAFFESIGSATPDQSFSNIIFTSGSKSFLQYSENCFVLKEALNVNDNFLSALRIQIENLFEGEDYIAFGQIDDYFYKTLPTIPANIQWSPLLLEDVLRIFDIGYITIEAGSDNDKKTIPAAILKKNSPLRTFSDLVWNEVSKAYTLPKEFTALEFREFLLDKGFIHGSEKMWNVHKTVAGNLRFYWTEKNSKVTIN